MSFTAPVETPFAAKELHDAPPVVEYSQVPLVSFTATTAMPSVAPASPSEIGVPPALARTVETRSPVGAVSFIATSPSVRSPEASSPGASLIDVETTLVFASLVGVATTPSSAVMVKVVVSVAPEATRFSAGSKVRDRIAVVAAAAVPENRYMPPPWSLKLPRFVRTPLLASSSRISTVRVVLGSTSSKLSAVKGSMVAVSFTA